MKVYLIGLQTVYKIYFLGHYISLHLNSKFSHSFLLKKCIITAYQNNNKKLKLNVNNNKKAEKKKKLHQEDKQVFNSAYKYIIITLFIFSTIQETYYIEWSVTISELIITWLKAKIVNSGVYPTNQQPILHTGRRTKWQTRFVFSQLSGTQLQTLLDAQSHTVLQTRLRTYLRSCRFLPKKRKKAQHNKCILRAEDQGSNCVWLSQF